MALLYPLAKVETLVGYLGVIRSALLEHQVELEGLQTELAVIQARPGRCDRQTLDELRELDADLATHRRAIEESKNELDGIGITYDCDSRCFLIPTIANDGHEARFLFDGSTLVGWQYTDDCSEIRRSLEGWQDNAVNAFLSQPEVGAKIWVDEQVGCYKASGYSRLGGWATVASVRTPVAGEPQARLLVEVEQFPGYSFDWTSLHSMQDSLQLRYGGRETRNF